MVNLRIPGPTPLPDSVLEAMKRQMINHRGPDFAQLIGEVTEHLKYFYQTENDLLILTASGTGAMEASVVNTLSPGAVETQVVVRQSLAVRRQHPIK